MPLAEFELPSRPMCNRRRRATVVVLLVLLSAGVAGWCWPRLKPAQAYARALAVAERDPASARKLLQSAIDASGGAYPEAELALCLMQARDNDWPAALAGYRRLDRDACPAESLLELGRLADAAGERERAVELFESVRSRGGPAARSAVESLAGMYARARNDKGLIESLHALAQAEPDNPVRWWDLVGLLGSKHRTVELRDVLMQAIGQDLPEGDRLDFRHRLIEVLLLLGDAAAASRELEQLADSERNSSRYQVHLANLHRLEGHPELALAALEQAFDEIGERPEALRLRAILYLDLNRFADAADDLQRVVETDPFNHVAHFKLADAYRGLHDLGRAKAHHEIAGQIKTQRLRINRLLAQVDEDPRNRAALSELAELYRALNDGPAAQHWEAQAAAIASTPQQ